MIIIFKAETVLMVIDVEDELNVQEYIWMLISTKTCYTAVIKNEDLRPPYRVNQAYQLPPM